MFFGKISRPIYVQSVNYYWLLKVNGELKFFIFEMCLKMFHFPRFYGSTLGKGSYLTLKAIVIPHIRDIQLETKAKFGNYV